MLLCDHWGTLYRAKLRRDAIIWFDEPKRGAEGKRAGGLISPEELEDVELYGLEKARRARLAAAVRNRDPAPPAVATATEDLVKLRDRRNSHRPRGARHLAP
jgi:hypothetical protein